MGWGGVSVRAVVVFAVDGVVPAVEALATCPLGEVYGDAVVVGGDAGLPVLVPDGVHPLLGAVGRAFAEHRPLVLSPDAVWLTIAQGVAQHVRLHAAALRPRLVGHQGRHGLGVSVSGAMPQDAESWEAVVAGLAGQLACGVDDPGLFECDFSTSGQVERVAGRVVLLDVYAPYFSYWLRCVCGIPWVRLTGTVEDWQRIRERVDVLAVFGLAVWRRSLAVIGDQLVHAAAGAADVGFWRRIYNPADAYGGAVVTGWVARLYPYLRGRAGALDVPNPLLELPIDEPRNLTTTGGWAGYQGPGVRSDAVPATLSRVLITVNDHVAGDNRVVALHAGLVGIAQDADGALRPVAGWHLRPGEPHISDVVDRLVREHHTSTPRSDRPVNATAELAALYDRVGDAVAADGTWRLLPVAEHGRAPRGLHRRHLVTIMDIGGGRYLAAAVDLAGQRMHWVTCRVQDLGADTAGLAGRLQRLLDEPADVAVYGHCLALVLTAILDGGDLARLETGRLSVLDTPPPPSPPPDIAEAASARVPGRGVVVPGPDAGLDEIRAAKQAAIGQQDYELAARLRDREKAALRHQVGSGWSNPAAG